MRDEHGRPFVEDYRELVEGIPAILYVDRPDEFSTNFYTSPQAEALLGYTQQEWGTDQDLWVRIIHPDDVDAVRAENERSNVDGEPFHAEYRIVAKDGRTVWIRDDALLVRDEHGEPSYWRGIMLDVSAEKEAEEKLRWSLDALRRTIQQRRELAQKIETAQEEARRQIAADIHDDPIQVMSAVDLRLAMLAEDPTSITTAALGELQSTVRLAIERLRSLVFELRPVALDREGSSSRSTSTSPMPPRRPAGPTRSPISSLASRSRSSVPRSTASCRKRSRTLASTPAPATSP